MPDIERKISEALDADEKLLGGAEHREGLVVLLALNTRQEKFLISN